MMRRYLRGYGTGAGWIYEGLETDDVVHQGLSQSSDRCAIFDADNGRTNRAFE